LLAAGFAQRLGATVQARVEPGPRRERRHPETGVLNADGVAAFARRLADTLVPLIERQAFPVVLGGDCSILLGGMLALRRSRRAGLLFIDGHADYYQPEAEPAGEVASMDLALACGRGPRLLADLEGAGPLVRDEDVVVLGFRDAAEQAESASQPLPEATHAIDLDVIRAVGIESAAQRAIDHLTRPGGPEDFWIHLDADVLDDAIMPAVDYRLPGGLGWDELRHVLSAATASGRSLGFELTIFNPTLDLDGALARRLSAAVADGLLAAVGPDT
jgi:arginase